MSISRHGSERLGAQIGRALDRLIADLALDQHDLSRPWPQLDEKTLSEGATALAHAQAASAELSNLLKSLESRPRQ